MDFLKLIEEATENLSQIKDPVPTVPGLVLNIDGDYMAYYASGDDECSEPQAKLNAMNLIRQSQDATGAERVVIHNTASGSHKGERYVIATVKPYQGQRDAGRKPKNYHFLRNWLLGYDGDRFRSKTWTSREADDGIGVMAYHAVTQPVGYSAIFTRDKDMQMLPGLHVDWLSKETLRVPPGAYEVLWKDRTYGTKWFWLQMLQGDAADNIPGLEGYLTTNAKNQPMFKPMGPKTAEGFLDGTTCDAEAYEVVKRLYKEFYDAKGGDYADRMVEQAALLWMRTDQEAQVGNFMTHLPLCEEVMEAGLRLCKRIKDVRAEANALAS